MCGGVGHIKAIKTVAAWNPPQIIVPGVDLTLHKGEITVHLVPERGPGQAAVGVDGVNLRHF